MYLLTGCPLPTFSLPLNHTKHDVQRESKTKEQCDTLKPTPASPPPKKNLLNPNLVLVQVRHIVLVKWAVAQ